MKTFSIILIVYAVFLTICVTLAVQSRIKKNQGFVTRLARTFYSVFLRPYSSPLSSTSAAMLSIIAIALGLFQGSSGNGSRKTL